MKFRRLRYGAASLLRRLADWLGPIALVTVTRSDLKAAEVFWAADLATPESEQP